MNRESEILNPESQITRVLLIEDNPGDARLVREMLIETGATKFNLKHVERINEGLTLLSQESFQVILLDLSLPDGYGLETVNRVCTVAPHVPVLVLTDLDDETLAIRSLQEGVQDYLVKGQMDGNLFLRAIRYAIERKQGEGALRESEKKYRDLVDNAPVGIYKTNLKGDILFANEALLKMFEFESPKEMMSVAPLLGYRNLKDREVLIENIKKKGKLNNYELDLITKSGKILNILLSASLEGDVLSGMMMDITERKRAEEALRANENKYRTLIENLPQKIFLKDRNSVYVSCNDNYAHDLKLNPAEITGKTDYDFYPKEFAEKCRADDQRIMELGKTEEIEERYIQNGNEVFVHTVKTPIKDEKGNTVGVLGIFRDITESKHAEKEMAALQEQFRQSQKMEAIGSLAGSIAHDFNNLLTIIKGYSELSLPELKEETPLWENIKEVQKATERASSLIRQLLAFSRRQILEMKVIDLNSLLLNLDKMLRRVIGEDIKLVTGLVQGGARVKVDPGQIEQVIMNLAVNARDAMPNGGKLTIMTTNIELDKEYARTHISVTPGRYVMLSVNDSGVGMTPEVRERIFEPFFTTKEKGKGTGLGLSTVYGIVKQSGGDIWVYSEPGHGTTFKIYLPRVDEPLEELVEKVREGNLPRGTETILVVEDEAEVRKLAVRILEKQGYRVLEGSDGEEVLHLCEKRKEPIHLILTDVIMPRMNGRELADSLKSLHPEMKVLYMSGYTDNTIVSRGILGEGINLIQKPFSADGLSKKVREVLGK